ncbi:FecCD family ABC transporter permease [Halarcobacter anaerophilus]|uniref:ABC transporter permease n=2 Tax=Halarcobacter anaerophilus TaxID=877500 RepID=A0A4Q0Y1Z6_9BACT|nr:iron ABC transporter permease [Halarcobacter anaerophilus]QDF29736.1 iron siderophore ABC transporter, permease protein [Halarcobacter anaerophilus]RXJ62659.1 ABC transporter permease [Halarcobacter anaerophilus]
MKPILVLFILLVIIAVFSLSLGQYELSVSEIINFFLYKIGIGTIDNVQLMQNIIIEIRFPRIVSSILIGASLAISGVAFQSMFKNPLVSPGILGVLSGASFGAALGMIFFKEFLLIQASSFVFGIAAVFIALFISMFNKQNQLILLILGGVVSSAFFSSMLSITKYMADPYDELPAIVYWMMGSLALIDKQTIYVVSIPILLGIFLMIFLSKYLNILSLGDEEAKSLGINVKLMRFVIILIATFISAFTVVLAGMIGWVGLVIPHIARLLFGSNNIIIVPISALLGGIYLLIIDNVSRTMFSVEIPIGILTSLIGIPFFAYALKNVKKGWG